MKIIADSSTTRTEWVLVDGDRVVERAFTSGMNPFFQTRREISHCIQPSARTLRTISCPSYRHELEPVPRMQASPGLRTSSPRAAPSRSLLTVTGVLNWATSDDSITLFLSALLHPEP